MVDGNISFLSQLLEQQHCAVCSMLDENMRAEPRSSEETEGVRRRRRRDVRECYSAEWAALRRKGSHQELELEWSVLCWDRESPGK